MEPAAVVFAIAVALASWRAFSVRGAGDPLLTPAIVAGLVVANLIAGTILLVLVGRRLAMRRSAASPLGGRGRLHVQLVALFSLSASVPVVLVAIFASVLFQSATEFWFSDRARTMLENANALAGSAYDSNVTDVEQETETMAGDLRLLLNETDYNTPAFSEQFALQLYRRELSEGGLYRINGEEVQSLSLVNPYPARPGTRRGAQDASARGRERASRGDGRRRTDRHHYPAADVSRPLCLRGQGAAARPPGAKGARGRGRARLPRAPGTVPEHFRSASIWR